MKTITADKLPNMHSTEFRGIPIVVQWPKGSIRVGERKDGTPYKTEMKADYGYVPNTIAEGDEERLDVYIGSHKDSDKVYVVEQVRKDTGEFDEYKVLLGFNSLEEAEELYEYQIKDGDVEMDDIGEVPFDYIFDKLGDETKQDEKVAAPMAVPNVVYHGTNVGRAIKIAEKGLLSGQEAGNTTAEHAYLCDKEQYAKSYADRKGGSTGVVLRITGVAGLEPDQNTGSKGDYKTKEKITPDHIEIKTAKGWEPITDWAQQWKIAADDKMTVIEAFVKNYKHSYDYFEEVSKHTAEELDTALQEAGIKAAVTHRAKRPRKLREKLIQRDQKRHYQSFREIYDDVVDLAGVRVALYLPADRMAVGEIIKQVFAPVRPPKEFPRDRSPKDGVGYHATHYLVQLRPGSLHKDELRYADTNIEIQVASVLMCAWAEVTHDLLYKPEKGTLTSEEMRLVEDLNAIVQAGEAKLEQLQESVEARSGGHDLRFELTAALAERLVAQSKGHAQVRIGAYEVFRVARQAALSGRIETGGSVFDSYLKAKLAIWTVHKADDLDERLKAIWEKKNQEDPSFGSIPPQNEDDFFWQAAVKQIGKGKRYDQLTKTEQSQVPGLAQQLKIKNLKP